jgi:hypothetical protein
MTCCHYFGVCSQAGLQYMLVKNQEIFDLAENNFSIELLVKSGFIDFKAENVIY